MKRFMCMIVLMLMFAPMVFALPSTAPTKFTWNEVNTCVDGTECLPTGYKIYWKTNINDVYTDTDSLDVGDVLTAPFADVS